MWKRRLPLLLTVAAIAVALLCLRADYENDSRDQLSSVFFEHLYSNPMNARVQIEYVMTRADLVAPPEGKYVLFVKFGWLARGEMQQVVVAADDLHKIERRLSACGIPLVAEN